MAGELELLRWIRERIGRRGGRIVVDCGDDAAVLRMGGADVLFKVDTVIEGVHFRRGDPLRLVGHKAVARPLSDIAAMGGVPVAAIVALMMPRSMSMAQARQLYVGMEGLGVPVVGGDIATHGGRLAISVSVLGEMRGVKPVLRCGARPGDSIVATGKRFGGSLETGHHLRFVPRLREGRLMGTRYGAHAMIDVSDGLVRDLGHVCEASGVGAELREEAIPCRNLRAALYDGEDYELLAALAPREARRAVRDGVCRVLGTFLRRRGIVLRRRDGRTERLKVRGWEHRLG